MNNTQLVRIIERLHVRTAKGEINWEPTVEEGEFQAAFADYAVRITTRVHNMYAAEPDYVLMIFNDDGQLLERVSNVDLEAEREDFFQLLKEVYSGARRKALRVDDALSSILAELEG